MFGLHSTSLLPFACIRLFAAICNCPPTFERPIIMPFLDTEQGTFKFSTKVNIIQHLQSNRTPSLAHALSYTIWLVTHGRKKNETWFIYQQSKYLYYEALHLMLHHSKNINRTPTPVFIRIEYNIHSLIYIKLKFVQYIFTQLD